MDGRPFRVSSQDDRRPVNRPAPAQQQQPVRQHVAPEPEAPEDDYEEPIRRSAPTRSKKSGVKPPFKRFRLPALIVLVLLIVGLGFMIWMGVKNSSTAIDSSRYQAIFFTNGQVYFGKLELFNKEYLRLTDVYYLQTQTEADADAEGLQQTSNSENNVQLVKLGEEIHGPEDEMVISKDQVLFYENLKTDGRVAQSIEQYKRANQ